MKLLGNKHTPNTHESGKGINCIVAMPNPFSFNEIKNYKKKLYIYMALFRICPVFASRAKKIKKYFYT